MQVEIITIGDELLIGQVVDTNSAWMANILNDNGFQVVRKAAVGDNADDIKRAMTDSCSRVSIVLVTGGLGPTKDDITLKTLCEFFETALYFSEEVYAHIENMFRKRGFRMNELTRNQAFVPEKATIIQNEAGTAPCTWFERNGSVLVSMPGVPFEMKWLMENEIVPRLKKKFHRDLYIKHLIYSVSGIPEAALAIKLTDFEDSLPSFVKLAYLPNSGMIRLRLSAYCEDEQKTDETLIALQKQLKEILKENIIISEEKPLEVVIGERFRSKNRTIGIAESCTGGSIAALLTSVSGSSDYFRGSIVAYSNEVKHRILGVSENDLQQYGAVSKQVVEQMAKGALQVLDCDYSIAVSGIAGPGGATPDKPVGTIWIAVASKDSILSKVFRFTNVREQNIQRTVTTSLIMLLKALGKNNG
jgi:nicotinamide-nucleotide amidase